jgi:hypothetical protein
MDCGFGAMKCRNIAKNITVNIEKEGKTLVGELDHVPMENFAKWGEGRAAKNML